MTFSFGIFNPLSRSPGESYRDSFQRGVAETLYAEALGFDAIWVPFTQLSPDFCFDAPTMVSAMMQASKTTRIKIGLAMQYMPFMHPWDVAAMGCAIDHVSGGRFMLGVGRGGAMEYADSDAVRAMRAKQTPQDVHAKYFEAVDVLTGVLRNERFSYHGRFYQFDNARITPRPYQDNLPIFSVAQSRETHTAMGKRGVNLLIPFPGYHLVPRGWEETAAVLKEYRQAWKDAGHAGSPQIVARSPCFVHETDEAALQLAVETQVLSGQRAAEVNFNNGFMTALGIDLSKVDMSKDARYAKTEFGKDARFAKPEGPERFASVEDAVRSSTLFGSPQTVTAVFRRLVDELGVTGVALEIQNGASTKREDHIRTMRLIADEVMPKFKRVRV